MNDNTTDIEKALAHAYSNSTLVHSGPRAQESYLTLASTAAESYVSTIDDNDKCPDSATALSPTYPTFPDRAYIRTERREKLAPITERSSIHPSPRLSIDNIPVAVEEDLPAKAGTSPSRWLRWNFFSYYRRLFSLVFIGNMVALIVLLTRPNKPNVEGFAGITYLSTISAAAINLVVAIMARNEHFVNMLFYLSVSLPLSAPLWLRARVAKIYCYGGLHSGCGTAAVIWYTVFSGLVARHIAVGPFIEPAIAALTFIILALLLLITIFAHPKLRQRFHNSFENTHRLAGWTIIGIFWVQVVLTAHYAAQPTTASDTGKQLINTPAFWCLIIITCLIVYPWLRLRSRVVHAEQLSPHAIRLHFDHSIPTYCMGVRITDSPLRETHAFATIPHALSSPPGNIEINKEERVDTPISPISATFPASTTSTTVATKPKGFSILISRAGDWTSKIIANPPPRLYFRGAPTIGVLRVATLFRSCVLVATGSGIGPCLSIINGYAHSPQRNRPYLNIRVLWSTPSPLTTYGQGIIDEVIRADPMARIIDTRALGVDENGVKKRPDMVKETWRLVREMKAEAVVIIGNPAITRKVVYAMETRGVPAFGPIWDS